MSTKVTTLNLRAIFFQRLLKRLNFTSTSNYLRERIDLAPELAWFKIIIISPGKAPNLSNSQSGR